MATLAFAGYQYWRRSKAAGVITLLAASKEAGIGAGVITNLISARDGSEAGDAGGNPALTTRKLRYAVFAAKNEFGDPPPEADRNTVGQWIRRYLAGRIPGSRFNVSPHHIGMWAPLLLEAVYTPTRYAVGAALLTHHAEVVGPKAALRQATKAPTLLEVFMGIKPLSSWLDPAPATPPLP